MSRCQKARVGDVLELSRNPVEIDPDKEYTAVGIKSFGRGLFHYPPTRGSALSKLRYFTFPSNALAISNIKAWEGAIALSSGSDHDAVASNRFLFYLPKRGVDIRYLHYYFLSEQGLRQIGQASPGSADRNRTLSIKNFENIKVDLPDLDEQRRIATKLDKLLNDYTSLSDLQKRIDQRNLDTLVTLGVQRILTRWASDTVAVGEACELVNDLVRPGDDPGLAREFVGLEHISPHIGERSGKRQVGEEKGRKFRFAPQDVLYGYLRPYLNKVWVADRHGLCSVEQYVLRSTGMMSPELIAYGLRSRGVLDQVISLTNNLQLPRLRSQLLLSLEIPFVASHHREEACTELNYFVRRVLNILELQKKRTNLLSGFYSSVLNAAFTGQL